MTGSRALGAGVLEHVDGPVPAVGGFQDHIGVFPGLRDLRRQDQGIIVDTHTAELVTSLGHPHDHRPAAMQIDTHDLPTVVLCLHSGASFNVRSEHPEHPAGSHQERGPAPSCHQDLDGELSLYRVRQRWPDGFRLSPADWKATAARERIGLVGPQRIEVWRATAAALDNVTGRLGQVPPGSPQWPGIARACADTLAAAAVAAEPDGFGAVSRAADILARAAAPKRAQPAPVDSAIARELRRIADAMMIAGASRYSGDAAAVVAVVAAAARLIVALAELRAAQQELHAAGAARVAAEQMIPLLQAQHAGAGVSEPVTGGRVSPVHPAGSPVAAPRRDTEREGR
jgi:hypothetical protein